MRVLLVLASLFFPLTVFADPIEYLVKVHADGPQTGTLRLAIQEACSDPGDALIIFDDLGEPEIRIMLESPLVIPKDCNGTITIKGHDQVPTIIDGSTLTGGSQPGETCSLNIYSHHNIIQNVTFSGNKQGAGVCIFGGNNTVQDSVFGEQKDEKDNPNLYGVVISNILGSVGYDKQPELDGGHNTVNNTHVLPGSDYGIWIQGNFSHISENTIESPQKNGIHQVGYSFNSDFFDNTVTHAGGQGFYLQGSDTTLEDNTIQESKGFGIWLEGNKPTLIHNTVTGSGTEGISLTKADNATIKGKNKSDNNGSHGLYVSGKDMMIQDSEFSSNKEAGIFAEGNGILLEGNTVEKNEKEGVVLVGNGNQMVPFEENGQSKVNTVSQNKKGHGVYVKGTDFLSEGSVIEDNGKEGSGKIGLMAEAANQLKLHHNQINHNAEGGVSVTGGDIEITTENHIEGNGGPGIVLVGNSSNITDINTIKANQGDGIHVEGHNASIVNNTVTDNTGAGVLALGILKLISENRVLNNSGDGIYVKGDGFGGPTPSVWNNKVESNKKSGIYVWGDSHHIDGNIVNSSPDYELFVQGNHTLIINNKISGTFKGKTLYVYGDDTEITGNSITNSGGHGILLSGFGAQIGNKGSNTIINSLLNGIFVSSGDPNYNGTQISGNSVTLSHLHGIVSVGAQTSVIGNMISQTDHHGLYVTGSPLTVNGNVVTQSGENGETVIGINVAYQGNVVRQSKKAGIYFSGNKLDMNGNAVEQSDGDGIVALQQVGNNPSLQLKINNNKSLSNVGRGLFSKGNSSEIKGNTLNNNGSEGLYHEGGQPWIESNYTINNTGRGMILFVDGGVVRLNTILDNKAQGVSLTGQGQGKPQFIGNTLKNNTGEGLVASGPGLALVNNHVEINQGHGFYVETNDGKIQGNQFINNQGTGARIFGAKNQILGNDVETNVQGGLFAQGDGSNVFYNIVKQNHVIGLSLHGVGLQISKNTVEGNLGGDGLWFEGKDSKISENTVNSNEGDGVNIFGDNNKILSNPEIKGNQQRGFYVSGDNNELGGNSAVTDNAQQGLYLLGESYNVHDNNISDNKAEGIWCEGSKATFATNTVKTNQGVGISLVGDDSKIVPQNTVSGNQFVGIYVNGNGNELGQNTIAENNQQGLYLLGDNFTVHGNTISGNGSDGILSQGANSKFAANQILANGGCPAEKLLSQTINCMVDSTLGGAGIFVAAKSKGLMIGGPNFAEDHNVIRYNRDGGLIIVGDKTNEQEMVTHNLISRNYGLKGPSYDLGNDGYTQNDLDDSDEGPNHLLNYIDYLQSFPLVDGPNGEKRYWSWGIAKFGNRVELYGVSTEDSDRNISHGGGDDYFGESLIQERTFQIMPTDNFNYQDKGWVTTISFDPQGNTSEYATNVRAGSDKDMDGIIDSLETGPGNKASASDLTDSDGDGLPDSVEDKNRNGVWDKDQGETSAFLPDSDGDGISDYDETHGDGVYDVGVDTDPLNADTDGDGIPDGQEDKNHNGIWEYHLGETNPLLPDSDGDGIPDNKDNCPSIANPGQESWYCSL